MKIKYYFGSEKIVTDIRKESQYYPYYRVYGFSYNPLMIPLAKKDEIGIVMDAHLRKLRNMKEEDYIPILVKELTNTMVHELIHYLGLTNDEEAVRKLTKSLLDIGGDKHE